MDDALKNRLMSDFGLNEDQVGKLVAEGVSSESDMALLMADQIKAITGCGLMVAVKIVKAFSLPVAAPVVIEHVDPHAEIPEGGRPSAAQINGFAATVGMDSGLLQTMMLGGLLQGGALGDMDLTTMMPIPNIVNGYSPKRRDISYMIMGQLEARFGAPIVVINNDGSVNHALTIKYVMSLDEGFEPAEDDIYYDESGTPYDVKGVGVDAQSVHDGDPLVMGKALQQNGMGLGRVTWSGVALDVRQVAHYAANQTKEIDVANQSDLQWLRDTIKPGMSRLTLKGKAPKALGVYNEAARAGNLPSLRVTLDRKPRRREVMPRRRSGSPRDLAGIGRPEGDL